MSRPSPAVYRRRRLVVLAGLVLVALVGGYLPVALLAPVPAAAAVLVDEAPITTTATVLSTPAGGSSAIALDGGSGTVTALGTSGSAESVPIASITKTVTALVVLDAMPIPEGGDGPGVTMTETDAQYLRDTIAVGGSWASVYPGQVLSERELIEIMMLESANNYSLTLTTWAFGSIAAYLDAAAAWLAENGLNATAVVDTSGLDPGSRSSTADLMRLASLALADPVLAPIVGTASVELPQLGAVDNTNDLLGTDGIDGVKTGTTDEAGFCLLFSADVVVGDRTVPLVGAVLGAASEDELHAAVLALLRSAVGGFQTVQLATAGEVVGSYTTAWGSSADIVTTESLSTLVWSATTVDESSEASALESADAGAEVGTARYTVAGVALDGTEFTVPLALGGDLAGPDAGWRLANPGRVFG